MKIEITNKLHIEGPDFEGDMELQLVEDGRVRNSRWLKPGDVDALIAALTKLKQLDVDMPL